MPIQLRYHIPPGTVLKSGTQSLVLHQSAKGIRAQNELTGQSHFWTIAEFLTKLESPGTQCQMAMRAMGPALMRIRRGGLFHRDQLSEKGRDMLDFRKALCFGIESLVARGCRIKAAWLDRPDWRREIIQVARQHFTKYPIDYAPRGGMIKSMANVPRGRTLKRYWDLFTEADYNEIVLADHNWLKGNRNPKLPLKVREFIREAIELVRLETKKPTVAAVTTRTIDLIVIENVRRKANDLDPLPKPVNKTVSDMMKKIDATALAVARDGERAAINDRTRGSTDTRALMIGELVEIDECKLSLIVIVKRLGLWQQLSEDDKSKLEALEDYVRTRLFLVLVLDVASRMPLGWVLTDAPSADATKEALRMATRSKEREKVIYGCDHDPMPAVGLACVVNDNGHGLRNSSIKTALLGTATEVIDVRAYHSGDKPHVEKMFGGMETRLFNLIHGYTGGWAGKLKGYDAIKSAAFVREELYAMITKYFVDVYPLEIHHGTTFFNQRPLQACQRLAKDGWTIAPMAPQQRRLAFGWRREATITDEGVLVFGLPFNSADLQKFRDTEVRKVSVYVDADCINVATVVIKGEPEPLDVEISWTAMRDITLAEFLAHAQHVRAEDPECTSNFELSLAKTRDAMFEDLRRKAIEADIPRSYMTIEEAQTKADVIMRGVHTYQPAVTPGTVPPGSLGDLEGGIDGVYDIGEGFVEPLDGDLAETDDETKKLSRPNLDGKLS
ncbi:MAG: hypothetical protein AAGF94_06020 [Pseudomonadota bacterium]